MFSILGTAWITALGVPALVAFGGFLAWVLRSSIEENREAERALTDERRKLYEKVLEPFMLLLTSSDSESEETEAEQQRIFASSDYKRAVFEMTLIASDEVVRAYGEMLNAFENPAARHPLAIWAGLILAIRKSVGNKGTQLTAADVLRTTIKDLDTHPDILKALSERR